MNGSADGARGAATMGWRVVAASTLDLCMALALAIAATVATLAVVITAAMGGSGAVLPASPAEASVYLLFPVFEILVFTPAGLVFPGVGSAVVALCWLSRRGILPGVSPGALILGTRRQGRGGSPS
jgi:hypothetical protein